MTIIKTSELQGNALDWAVWRAEFAHIIDNPETSTDEELLGTLRENYRPSVDWTQGGPIIEREKIKIIWLDDDCEQNLYAAQYQHPFKTVYAHSVIGETYLIAAMRCYVASKLGDNVDIPDELL